MSKNSLFLIVCAFFSFFLFLGTANAQTSAINANKVILFTSPVNNKFEKVAGCASEQLLNTTTCANDPSLPGPSGFFSNFENAPFDGLTIVYGAIKELKSKEEITSAFQNLNTSLQTVSTDTKVWKNGKLTYALVPLVRMSRLVGNCMGTSVLLGGGKTVTAQQDPELFQRINKIGCLAISPGDENRENFLFELKKSVEFAVSTGHDTIFIDPEAYVNYNAVKFGTLVKDISRRKKISLANAEKQAIADLRNLGTRMADVIEEASGGKTIYIFTQMVDLKNSGSPQDKTNAFGVVFNSALTRAKSQNYAFRLIEGGGTLVPRQKYTRAWSNENISKQNTEMKTWLQKFPNLKLGAPISFWDNFKVTYCQKNPSNLFTLKFKGVFGQNACNSGVASLNNTTESLQSTLNDLLNKRRYVWIYHSFSVNPYYDVLKDKGEANQAFVERVNKVIRAARN